MVALAVVTVPVSGWLASTGRFEKEVGAEDGGDGKVDVLPPLAVVDVLRDLLGRDGSVIERTFNPAFTAMLTTCGKHLNISSQVVVEVKGNRTYRTRFPFAVTSTFLRRSAFAISSIPVSLFAALSIVS